MGLGRDSETRRLLVITYHYPPDGAVGGQRWAGLSKYLARLGWEVHIITASAGDPQDGTPGVHRHFRPRRGTLNEAYRSVAGRLRQTSSRDRQVPPPNPDLRPPVPVITPITAARRILRSSIDFPDVGRGWILRATAAARSLLREKKFDVVVTSGPPHSAHFAGLLATAGQDALLWIDMRDPWSAIYGRRGPDAWYVRAERLVLRHMERLIFQRADKVVANTREFASALRVADPQLDVVWFPNGVDLETVPPRDSSAVERGSIAYIGTLYAYRGLATVCEAMRRLLEDRPEAAETLRLNVAGAAESPQQLRDDIAAAGLTSLVTLHGMLPRAKALDLLNRSHLALVLAQDLPMAVPAKLFESVGLGIPTLVIAEDTSPAAREARRIGAMTVDGRDVQGLRALFEDLIAGRIPTTIAPNAAVSYEELASRMDRLLRDAVARRYGDAKRDAFDTASSNERQSVTVP